MKKNKNILLQMHRHEAKTGVRRTSVEHGLGTFCQWSYILFMTWATLMHLLYFVSVSIQRNHTIDAQSGDGAISVIFEDYINVTAGSLSLVGIMSFLMLVGAVCMKLRFYIPCAVLNLLPSIVLIFHFKSRMSNLFEASGSIPLSYVIRHLAPLIIVAAAAITYSVIGILFNISENRAYERFVSKIYEQHPDRFGKMTDEEWNEFLDNYTPPTKKEAKRARKQRAKSGEKEKKE